MPDNASRAIRLPGVAFAALFAVCLLCALPAIAQETPFTLRSDSLLQQHPAALFGFDKTGSTFLFHGNMYGVFSLPYGSLFLRQQYIGRAIRTENLSVRDNEECSLLWLMPVSEQVDVSASGSLLYSADALSASSNEVQDVALFGGAHYRPWNNSSFGIGVGGVQSAQAGFAEQGWRLIGTGSLVGEQLDDYMLDADARGDYSRVGDRRTISHSVLSARFARTFADNEYIEINARTTTLRRDQYVPFTILGSDSVTTTRLSDSIETRSEQRISLSGLLNFPMDNNGSVDIIASVENTDIDRYYDQLLSTVRESGVTRTLSELKFSVAAAAKLQMLGGRHEIALGLESREEQNAVSRRFAIGDTALTTQRLRENLRDNSSQRTSLSARSRWLLSAADTLQYSGSAAILRYDTPSADNSDDRDELFIAADAVAEHRFSPLLAVSLTGEIQLVHTVFLKALRSAQNNWNRIIRFAPAVAITGKYFSAVPRFEVVANYTNFDYEDLLGSRRSLSSRQLGYTDSLVYRFTEQQYIESRITVRYEERGEFRWKTFSEIPNFRKTEQFYTVLFFTNPMPALWLGAGGRYYQLAQRQLGRVTGTGTLDRTTLGPETVITAQFASGTTLRLHGWYEIQFDNGRETRRLPNLLLDVMVAL